MNIPGLERHASDLSARVSAHLTRALNDCSSLNELLERALPPIAVLLGAPQTILIDYREHTDHFDLLHFAGYTASSRFDLQHRMSGMELRQALRRKDAFAGESDPRLLYIPLYFSETLEGVLVLEAPDPIALDDARREMVLTVSRFFGLLMSSGRLPINKLGIIDPADLQNARQIQLSYLPSPDLSTERYEVYGYNRSSALVGGDYFDYFRGREGSLQCVVADACGHGLSAALIVSGFRALLQSEISRLAVPEAPGSVLEAVNRSVHSGGTLLQYLTGIYFDYDETSRYLRYANAGHFEPLLVHADGTLANLAGGGPPLGTFKMSSYPTFETAVKPGDLLVLFTDGLVDLRNAHDEYFGLDRVRAAAVSRRERPLTEIASSLLADGMAFNALPQPEDDLTLFLVRFL